MPDAQQAQRANLISAQALEDTICSVAFRRQYQHKNTGLTGGMKIICDEWNYNSFHVLFLANVTCEFILP